MTTLGVIFGSFVLAASLSIGQGVQARSSASSHRSDFLRKIVVTPRWRTGASEEPSGEVQVAGEMSRRNAADSPGHRSIQSQLRHEPVEGDTPTPEKVRALAALAHVESVVPVVYEPCYAVFGDHSQLTGVEGRGPTTRSAAGACWPADSSIRPTNGPSS